MKKTPYSYRLHSSRGRQIIINTHNKKLIWYFGRRYVLRGLKNKNDGRLRAQIEGYSFK